jgi:hypothetical protein
VATPGTIRAVTFSRLFVQDFSLISRSIDRIKQKTRNFPGAITLVLEQPDIVV